MSYFTAKDWGPGPPMREGKYGQMQCQDCGSWLSIEAINSEDTLCHRCTLHHTHSWRPDVLYHQRDCLDCGVFYHAWAETPFPQVCPGVSDAG